MSHYINGSWIEGEGKKLTSLNPATNETLWSGASATKEEVDAAVIASRAAFPAWARLKREERIPFLKEYERNLRDKAPFFAELIAKETGKPLWEAHQEVGSMIGKIDLSIEAYEERCPEKKLSETLTIHHKPHGVAAIYGPFNFPGHLPNGHIVPALLAGNTFVLKSNSHTPLVAQEMLKCLAHLPQGVANLVQGGPATGHFLAAHPHVDAIFFTGSHRVGTQLAAQPHKIVALEMGGNNPLVVWDVDDLESAAHQTILSAYLTSGQRCTCARRLILPEGKEGDKFLEILSSMIESMTVGPYTDEPEPFMGPLINGEIVERLLNTQATLPSEGGNCLVEMHPIKEGFPFLTPGLMDVTTVRPHDDEELFGPFLRVWRVPTFEKAIEEANNTAYGLAAALFSLDREKYAQFYHEVRAGVINWNHPTTGASGCAPFGGLGKSGNFRPSGYYAVDYCAYPVASMENPTLAKQ